jgi:hypothetical protein
MIFTLRVISAEKAPPDPFSPVEQFKTFVASPPEIETLVFREKLSPDLTKPRPYDGSFAKSTNFALFKGAWQKDALLLFHTTNETAGPEYLPGRLIVSIFNGEHWLLDPGRYVETCTAPFGSFNNPVTVSIALNVLNLQQVLQGGVMQVRPGDINWDGDRFIAKNVITPYKLKFRVEGKLMELDGRPSEMLVSCSTGNSSTDVDAHWRIKYSYERELGGEFFPSRIRVFSIRDEAEVEMDDFEILKLQLAARPLPRSMFDPGPMLAEHPVPVQIFTNNAMYLLLPGGGLRKLERASGMLAHSSNPLDPRLALCGLCGMNFLFLVFLLKARKRIET